MCSPRSISPLFGALRLSGLILCLLVGLQTGVVRGHNLDAEVDYLGFDSETIAALQARALGGQPLLQLGDTVGLILKATPRKGTPTGAGGYSTFFIPVGTQVVGADYGELQANGLYVPIPMKGPAIVSKGAGSIGPKATPALIGLQLGPNVTGVSSLAVGPFGSALGTMAGVYGDTGIFYSTDPKTAWQSWVSSGGYDRNAATSDNYLSNNSGDSVVPTTQWDAEQLLAFGVKSPVSPIVDSGDGRGNAPWGMASGVAGPQSGYAWAFNKTYWDANPADPSRMKNSVKNMGPWQRIQYPGSLASKDQPGLTGAANGYAVADASSSGFALSAGNPLPPTTSWSDATSPKAVRISWGGLELSRPEYCRVKLKIVVGPGQPNSPFSAAGFLQGYADTFGGDAGGESGNKDHLWRYYRPTTVSLSGMPLVFKRSSKEVVAPNEVFNYQIYVLNFGTSPLTNVVIEDTLPSGVAFISASPPQNSGPNPLVWNLGGLLPQEMRVITVNVRATGSGVLTNTVCGRSDQSTPTCNTETTTVGFQALLYPDKTVTPTTALPAATVDYTISIRNNGTANSALPMVITDYLPSGFTYASFVSASVNGAPAPTGTVVPNATNPAQPVFNVSAAIKPAKTLDITFRALISGSQPTGVYYNTYSYAYSGKVMSTGSLAPVTVGGGRIGDTVFRDWNGNGTQDTGDDGLSGVTVELYASNGTTLLGSKVTDGLGFYQFSPLVAGTYVVKVIPPSGYFPSYDFDGISTANQATATITSGQQKLDIDFGYRPGGGIGGSAGIIRGTVFEDTANNHSYDGTDVPIPGASVSLYRDANGNGAVDAAGDFLLSTRQSGADGAFSFTALVTGVSYIVKVDASDAGVDAHFPGQFQTSTGLTRTVTNLSGTSAGADFGFWGIALATAGDLVFRDVNANGIFDGSDVGLPNVGVKLYFDLNGDIIPDAGGLIETVQTDSQGFYLFRNLGTGRFLAVLDTADVDIPGGLVAAITSFNLDLSPGENISTADFPLYEVIGKTVDKAVAAPAEVLTYTITPEGYAGTDLLTNFRVTDTVPTGTNFLSAAQGGVQSGGTVTWNLGTNTPPVPGITVTTSLYGFSGNKLNSFYRYDTGLGTWAAMSGAPGAVGEGGAVATDGTSLFALQGNNLTGFWKFDVVTNAWVTLAAVPAAVKGGGSLVCDGADLYALRGGGKKDFWKYDSGANAWSVLANAPENVDDGGAMVYDGAGGIYTLRGAGSNKFWRYNIDSNTWTNLSKCLKNGKKGAALTIANGVVYAFPGGGAKDFLKFDVAANKWTALKSAPAAVDEGAALTTVGSSIFAMGGNGTNFWLYTPAANLWTAVSNVPTTVKFGGALIQQSLATERSANLGATPLAMRDAGAGKTVTVTMTLDADLPISGVSPGDPTYTVTGAATATKLTGPIQSTANGSTIFTWTYNVRAGTGPGSVTFSRSSFTSGGQTWPASIANSVLITPALTLRVTVANPATVSLVSNVAVVQDDGVIAPTTSPAAITSLTGSIGDTVFVDLDGNGVQGSSETGLAGAQVSVTNGTVSYAATTDGLGKYRVPGLNANGGQPWTVSLTLSTLPANWSATTPPVLQRTLALASSQINDADFGVQAPSPIGSISGVTYRDTNANLLNDPGVDPPIANITVRLYRDSGTVLGVLDAGDPLQSTTSTNNATGTYFFGSLQPGNFLVDVDQTDPDLPAQYGLATLAVDPAPVVLAPSESRSGVSFPFVLQPSILIKSVSAATAVPGAPLTYSLNTNYTGSSLLANARVTDAVPAGTTFVSAGQGGTNSAGTITWNLGSNTAAVPGSVLFGNIAVPSGLVGGWSFDADGQDYSGNGRNGTLFGGALINTAAATNKIGPGKLEIITNPSYLNLAPHLASFTALSQGSFSFWYKTSDAKGVLFSASDASTNNHVALYLDAGKIGFDVKVNNSYVLDFQSKTTTNNYAWHHGVVTVGPSGNKLYVDGVQVAVANMDYWTGTAATQRFFNNPVGMNSIGIGSAFPDSAWAYTGLIDDFRVYNTVLTAADVTAIYSSTVSGGQPSTLNTSLSVEPVLVNTGSTVTVKMQLSSIGLSLPNVSPNTLTVTGTNGAGATLISGPTPASATIGTSPTTFIWTYQVTGSNVGQVTFTGNADNNGAANWPNASTNSIIVHPVLTFNVVVANPATDNPVFNTAYIRDNSVIPPTASNTVQTGLGGSVGDFVWIDEDGDGLQDASEPGLAGISVIASNGTLTRTAVTDALGQYRIYGLNANGGAPWMVSVSLPAGMTATTPSTLLRVLATDNTAVNDADFGIGVTVPPNATTVSIAGTVWMDDSLDGIIDTPEIPVGTATIQLYRDLNTNGTLESGDLLIREAITAADGTYRFTALPIGSYLVKALDNTLPPGVILVTGGANLVTGVRSLSIPANTDVTGVNFGYSFNGSIAGTVFFDTNADGVRDANGVDNILGNSDDEAPVDNAGVALYIDADLDGQIGAEEMIQSMVLTNASGQYTFTRLPPDHYVVKVEERYIPAPPTSSNAGLLGFMMPTAGETAAVVLAPSQAAAPFDFGFAELTELKGYVFHDVNSDGLKRDSEPGLPGITVNLNGQTAAGPALSRTLVSDAEGEYEFLIPPGSYVISFNAADPDFPAGLTRLTTPATYSVSVNGGLELEGFNFGRDNAGALGGMVFDDVDGNGVKSAGEAALANVVVEWYDGTGVTLFDAQITAADGTYRFDGVPDASYVVKVRADTLPAQFDPIPTVDPTLPLDGNGNATVTNGSTLLTLNYGYRLLPGSLAGSVVFGDGDGIAEAGEPAVNNVTVTMVWSGVDGISGTGDDVTRTTQTNASGAYSFSNVRPGPNTLSYAVQAGYWALADVDGGSPNSIILTLAPGQNVTGRDFEQGALTVGNLVWQDTNNNGLKDVGESGIPGVIMQLWSTGTDNVIGGSGAGTDTQVGANVVTDASGIYSFTLVPTGRFYVRIPTPPTLHNTVSAVVATLDNGVNDDNNGAQSAAGQPVNSMVITLGANTEPGSLGTTNIENTIDFGFQQGIDYGDHSSFGSASSYAVSTITLGAVVDSEAAVTTNATATGDDSTGMDDEEGVVMPATIWKGMTSLTLTVVVNNTSAGNAYLNAWIDFNRNGNLGGAGQQVLTNRVIPPGTVNSNQTITVNVPNSASNGTAGARFRLTDVNTTTSTGLSGNGEVEDYVTNIVAAPTQDFGDNSLFASAGSTLLASLKLGALTDMEPFAITNATATGDDITATADEDAVSFGANLYRGQSNATVVVNVTNTTGSNAYLNGWIDFNNNGSLADAGEQIVANQTVSRPLTAVDRPYTFTVPVSAVAGTVGARFRITSTSNPGPTGSSGNGEVEDLQVIINPVPTLDFGDYNGFAKASSTLLAAVKMGTNVDAEVDAFTDSTATGDDLSNLDDEDGITLPASVQAGQTGNSVTVRVTNSSGAPAYLSGWMDFNNNGILTDPGEQIISSKLISSVTSNANNLNLFNVPPGAFVGSVACRFRLTSLNNAGPTGQAGNGEVEDIRLTINAPTTDFGDFSLFASASSTVLATLKLGALTDTELVATATPAADGDDTTGSDDEDGISLPAFVAQGQTGASVTVNLTNTTGSNAYLNGWADFNNDGVMDAVTERIISNVTITRPLGPINQVYTFNVPAGAFVGTVGVRFRLTSTNNATSIGASGNGEVEDHLLTIVAARDYGDFATFASASATVDSNLRLGVLLDSESAAVTNTTATGDDITGTDDEDGAVIPSMISGAPVTIPVTVQNTTGGTAYLSAWIDFNNNGVATDPGEQVAGDVPVPIGSDLATLDFTVPPGAVIGSDRGVRLRLADAIGAPATGYFGIGEVEDYTVSISAPTTDFGDWDGIADASSTVNANLRLGASVDTESLATLNALANGDDTTGVDDEDGVTLPVMTAGGPAVIPVVLTNTSGSTGYLNAWIDYNNNGFFGDAGEQLATNTAIANNTINGTQNLAFTVPTTARTGAQLGMRFRLTSTISPGATGLSGIGEVEDYTVVIVPPTTDFGDFSRFAAAGATTNGSLRLGQLVDTEYAATTNLTATGDDITGSDDEDGVTIPALTTGAVASLGIVVTNTSGITAYLSAWIDYNNNGVPSDPGEAVAYDVPVPTGSLNQSYALNIPVPLTAATGVDLGLRFRLSSVSGAGPTGTVGNGEIEDLVTSISTPVTDFGDWAGTADAWNTVNPNLRLGALTDMEFSGTNTLIATGDDLTGVDDEDGVTLPALVAGAPAIVPVVVSNSTGAAGYLNGWIDYNNNGLFTDPGEQMVIDVPISHGSSGSTLNVSFTVPLGAAFNTNVGVRFRATTNASPPPSGFGGTGEVEDYVVTIAPPLDFGDLADATAATAAGNYQTLLANNGPRHTVINGLRLGANLDTEINGAPSANADGDDTAGTPDDEDAISSFPPFMAGVTSTVTVNTTNTTATAAKLSVWVDFNNNGSFADAGEQVAVDTTVAVNAASVAVPVPVPLTVAAGVGLGFRVRLSHDASLTSLGAATDGEVEDYRVTVAAPLDFGDLADGTAGTAAGDYQTLLANNGPRHVIVNGLRLGANADAELIGTPSANADGDDTTGTPDDEDAISSFPALMAGVTSNVTVTTTNTTATAARLSVWVDFNNNGSFADAGEQVAVDTTVAVNAASVVVPVPAPLNATTGVPLGFRVRLSHDAALTSLGAATDGEVEDHRVTLAAPLDFGDLADGTAGTAAGDYQTLLANNGPRHVIVNGLRLGTNADAEFNGAPSANADGDDTTGTPDDEDAISFFPAFMAGVTSTVAVTTTNTSATAARLSVWVDFNNNGSFADAGEQVAVDTTVAVNAASVMVPVPVPLTATAGVGLGFRVRLSHDASLTSLGAATDGEVEDYRMTVAAPLDFGDLADGTAGTAAGDYQTLVVNNGPRHVIVNDLRLGTNADPEFNGIPSANADGDDTTGTPDDEDAISSFPPLMAGVTSTVTVTTTNTSATAANLSVWVDFNNNGSFADAGEQVAVDTTVAVNAASVAVPVPVPLTAATGVGLGFRVRLSHDASLTSLGAATDGEVEDYRVTVAVPLDFGDLADGTAGTAAGDYQTLLANNGPRHVIVNGLRLGTNADAEFNGAPGANADGDDTAGTPDDEDAISSFPALMASVTSTVTVTTTNTSATAANLSVWVDFNNNGSFADAGEQVAVDATVAVNAASVVVPVPVPAGAVTGVALGFRVRLSHDAALTSLGAATDGEVEDHRVTILLPADLGDWDGAGAATTTSSSLLSNNLRLGATVDAETSVTPDADATADGADEDGVTMPAFITLSRSVTIPVSVFNNSGANAYLNAWIDLNGDGTFNDTVVSGNNGGERLVAVRTIPAGASPTTQNITFTVPSGANTGIQRGVRFRLTSQAVTTPTGLAGTGEVEDYVVEIMARRDFGDWNGSGALTASTSSNYSPTLYLGADVDTEVAPVPNADATSDDTTDDGSPDDEDGVLMPSRITPGMSIVIPVTVFNNSGSNAYLSAWIDFNNNGSFLDSLVTSGGERLENVRTIPSSASATTQNINFTVPVGASIGTLRGVRFRLTSVSNPGPTGRDGNGEVEDYTVEIKGLAVGDLVWNDLNGDGLKDASEPGVAGLQLTLINPGTDNAPGGTGPATDTLVATVTTGAGGLYRFQDRLPGNYYLTFNPPVGLPYVTSASVTDNQINNDSNGLQPGGAGSAVYSPVFQLTPGLESVTDGDTDHDTDLTKDFGLMVTRQTLGDFVWNDTNGNGLQDPGEPGVNGVRVDLYQDNGDMISDPATDTLISTTTSTTIASQDGRYTNVALNPGNYFSVFTPPDTWGITIANAGTDDALDSDTNAAIIAGQRVGISPVTILSTGEDDLSWDAGLTDRSGIPAVWAVARQTNGKLIVGGRFKTSHGIARNNICRVGTDGSLDTSFDPGSGFNGSVRSLAVLGDGSIAAGGSFTTYRGLPANGLAVISADGTTLLSCAMPDQPAVHWVAWKGSQIYVGGQFTSMGGVPRNGFARLSSGGSGSWVCDTSFAAGSGANAVVHGGTFDTQGRLYLVGDFTSFHGTSCGRIARLTTQGMVDATFNPGGVGANRRILSALATTGDWLFLTGEFTTFGGASFNGTVHLGVDGTLNPNYAPSELSVQSVNASD